MIKSRLCCIICFFFSCYTVKKSNKVKAKLKGDSISEAADVTTGSAIYDDTLPTMDVSIKQGGSKQIKLKWNSYEGAAYYTVFY